MFHNNPFGAAAEKERQEALLPGQKREKPQTTAALQWLKNGWRTAISPFTQTLMAIGIFPAQALSTVKKIPVLKSIIGFITRKTGNDSRSAANTFQEDFIEKKEPKRHGSFWNFFNKNPKAKPFDTTDLIVTKTETAYTTDFNRNVKLETFNFEHETFQKKSQEDRYYRIHCGNNTANCSRFFTELATLSKRHPELKTITYNHPGVEGSDGITMSKDDLVNALYAQVKTLIKNGANPKNIELSGFSIGAATAALTAAKLKEEGIEVNLYNDRTFSTMGNVVTNGFPGLGLAFKLLKAIPGVKELTHHVLQPLVKNFVIEPLLWLTNWDMDPARAYKAIAPERRALTVVKQESKGNGIFKSIGKYIGKFTGFFKKDHGDAVIPTHVSLLSGTEDPTEKARWKQNILTLEQDVQEHHEKISNPELLNALKPDNSISSDALVRLKLAAQHGGEVSEIISLLKVGTKARRFHGVKESNAHNNTSEKLECRIKPETMKKALCAAGLSQSLPANGVTLYSLHHEAVRNKNQRNLEESRHSFSRSSV